MRRRIMFLSDAGDANGWCGVSESLLGLVRNMRPVPLCVTAGEHGLTKALRREGLPVKVVSFPIVLLASGRLRGPGGIARIACELLWYAARVIALARNAGVGAVYVTGSIPSLAAALTAWLAGFRVVLGVRGGVSNSRTFRYCCRRAVAIVALSEEMKDDICGCFLGAERHGIRRKTRVIYNGVDTSRSEADADCAAELRRTLSGDGARSVVLVNGNFCVRKAQEEILTEIIPRVVRLPEHRRRFVFVFIGAADGTYAERCRDLIMAFGLSDVVRIEGLQDNPWTWMAACDIVLLCSKSEGMPRSVLEGMSCGKPIVCFRVTSVRELVEATGAGVVVEPGEYEVVAEAIRRLGRDQGLREDMGAAGRRFVRDKCELTRIASHYDALFAEVAGFLGR